MKRGSRQTTERVFLAVDVNNLWHSCREVFGFTARVDYALVLGKVRANGYAKVSRKVQAVAYTITAPHRRVSASGRVREDGPRNTGFLATLKRLGYQVKTRHMKYTKEEDKPFRTDWDVGITVDVLGKMEQYDTFILASGDGDFVPLLQQLQKAGKRVEVYTFKNATSQLLYDQADNLVYLGEDVVYHHHTKGTA